MPVFWVLWLALGMSLGSLIFLRLRERRLQARCSSLSNELERCATALDEAHQSLNRVTGVDAVTSLPNHNAFQEFLRGEWRRALREASAISVLIIDIDRFTEFNDELGHPAGDACLAHVGNQIKTCVRRPGDLVALYGGEKFGVVMSRTNQRGALQVAQRICSGVEGLAIAHPESDVSPCVTVSIGVATSTPAVDSNWEELELVAGAKAALVHAKQSGRNRISIGDTVKQPVTG
jgi:diguanylate cyclase (GGDEF)-like protein